MQKNLVFTIVAVVSICLALLIFFVSRGEEADRIYTNVYIHGVNVGGLTAEEAEAELMERFQPMLESRMVTYTIRGQTVAEFEFADFGAQFDFSLLVEDALDRGWRLFGRGHMINDPMGIQLSPAKVESVFSGLVRQLEEPAIDASFAMVDGKIEISDHDIGQSVDIGSLVQVTQHVLASVSDGIVEVQLIPLFPNYAREDFEFDISVLGAFRTEYSGTDADPRVYNVRLAAERVHNQVLYPGETFSAGAIIGAHKPNSGYKPAIVLVQGEPVEDIGGGVCQVVTTLYNAVLAAELAIVQRHNHSAPVSYVDRGFDATVAGDYLDLKFKNNTAHPVLITSNMMGGGLTISIHGHDSRPAERTIRFVASRVGVTDPVPCREVVDASIPFGERVTVLAPQPGYHIELHKHVYMSGQEVEVVKISTSIYKPLQGVVAIGAG